jgi:hypothetical protein
MGIAVALYNLRARYLAQGHTEAQFRAALLDICKDDPHGRHTGPVGAFSFSPAPPRRALRVTTEGAVTRGRADQKGASIYPGKRGCSGVTPGFTKHL